MSVGGCVGGGGGGCKIVFFRYTTDCNTGGMVMAPQYSRIQFSTSKQEINIGGHWFGNAFFPPSLNFVLFNKNCYLKNGLINYIYILHNTVLIPRSIKKVIHLFQR